MVGVVRGIMDGEGGREGGGVVGLQDHGKPHDPKLGFRSKLSSARERETSQASICVVRHEKVTSVRRSAFVPKFQVRTGFEVYLFIYLFFSFLSDKIKKNKINFHHSYSTAFLLYQIMFDAYHIFRSYSLPKGEYISLIPE